MLENSRIEPIRITMLPIGPVPSELCFWLKTKLPEQIDSQISLAGPIAIPSDAYEHRRQQYLGESILFAIRQVGKESTGKMLGLINEDCYSEGHDFIYGVAALKGKESLVALPRMRPSFYSQPDNTTLFFNRVLKEALHELGHSVGLVHCANSGCVMHFSDVLRETGLQDAHFCMQCREQVLVNR